MIRRTPPSLHCERKDAGSIFQGFRDGYRKRVNLTFSLPFVCFALPVQWWLLGLLGADDLLRAMMAAFQVLWAATAVSGQYFALRKARR